MSHLYCICILIYSTLKFQWQHYTIPVFRHTFFFCNVKYYSVCRTRYITISIKILAVKLGKGQKQHQAEHTYISHFSLLLTSCGPILMINKSFPALGQNVFHACMAKRTSTICSRAGPENRIVMSHSIVVSLTVMISGWMLL